MDEQRMIEIETKIAHQEALIDDLQESVRENQKTIETIQNFMNPISLNGFSSSSLRIFVLLSITHFLNWRAKLP